MPTSPIQYRLRSLKREISNNRSFDILLGLTVCISGPETISISKLNDPVSEKPSTFGFGSATEYPLDVLYSSPYVHVKGSSIFQFDM